MDKRAAATFCADWHGFQIMNPNDIGGTEAENAGRSFFILITLK